MSKKWKTKTWLRKTLQLNATCDAGLRSELHKHTHFFYTIKNTSGTISEIWIRSVDEIIVPHQC